MVDLDAIVWRELMKVRSIRADPEREDSGRPGGLGRLSHLAAELGVPTLEVAKSLARISLDSFVGRIAWEDAVKGRADFALELEGGIDELVREARGSAAPPDDRLAWEAAMLLVGRFRERGAPVPQALADLSLDAAAGRATAPSSKKGTRRAEFRRRQALIGAIRLAMESGLQEFQSDTDGPAASCTALVCDMAESRGIVMQRGSVIDLWNRYKRSVKGSPPDFT